MQTWISSELPKKVLVSLPDTEYQDSIVIVFCKLNISLFSPNNLPVIFCAYFDVLPSFRAVLGCIWMYPPLSQHPYTHKTCISKHLCNCPTLHSNHNKGPSIQTIETPYPTMRVLKCSSSFILILPIQQYVQCNIELHLLHSKIDLIKRGFIIYRGCDVTARKKLLILRLYWCYPVQRKSKDKSRWSNPGVAFFF